MKKIVITASVILSIIIFGIILIQVKERETNVTKEETLVGIVFNGSKTDESWNQSHYEGMEMIAEELNLSVKYREYISEDETCLPVIEELIEEGAKIIIGSSFGYGPYVEQLAEKYPEIYFFHATGVGYLDNMSTFFGRIYQARYLSGIVAGMQTETNQIGYVAAFPLDEVNRGINAFTLGVRSVNPNANVYIAWTNSWGDDEAGARATEKLLSEHDIDVLTLHTNTNIPLQIAEERGIWCIGYNVDNHEKYPNSYLTASVWQWENFYKSNILECLQGKFRGQHYWLDTDTGVIALAPLTKNIKSGIEEVVQEKRTRIRNGEWDVFFGPIKDRDGNIRVAEGESMTDYSMLNEFDWYVEGVITDESE